MLLVRDPGGSDFLLLHSKEGVTQGEPIAMIMYAIGPLPLIHKLKSMYPNSHQSWYADDSSAIDTLEDLHSLFDALVDIGPSFGYFPNGSKSIVVVPSEHVERANHYFNKVHGHNFSIKTGARHLGCFVGDEVLRDKYVSSKISDWVYGVSKLAMVATKNQPHAAFTGFFKSLQHEWTFIQRFIPGIGRLFHDLESAIRTNFLPALLDEPAINDNIRDLIAILVKFSGMRIPNLTTTSAQNFEQSQVS